MQRWTIHSYDCFWFREPVKYSQNYFYAVSTFILKTYLNSLDIVVGIEHFTSIDQVLQFGLYFVQLIVVSGNVTIFSFNLLLGVFQFVL